MSVRVDVAEETGQPRGPGWLVWLAWALLALLLGVGFWLLLGACGIRMLHGMPILAFCPGPPLAPGLDPALGAEIARQRALEAEIGRLQLALSGAPPCRPPAHAEVVPAPPPPAPAPAPPPKPEAIPEDAWKQRDISFLKGCWNLDSHYQTKDAETGRIREVKDWQVCFDAAGQGRQTLTFDDGSSCTGPMLGKFDDQDQLLLQDTGNLPCEGGFYIYRRQITCDRVDPAHAQCNSFQPETRSHADVTFRHREEAAK